MLNAIKPINTTDQGRVFWFKEGKGRLVQKRLEKDLRTYKNGFSRWWEA